MKHISVKKLLMVTSISLFMILPLFIDSRGGHGGGHFRGGGGHHAGGYRAATYHGGPRATAYHGGGRSAARYGGHGYRGNRGNRHYWNHGWWGGYGFGWGWGWGGPWWGLAAFPWAAGLFTVLSLETIPVTQYVATEAPIVSDSSSTIQPRIDRIQKTLDAIQQSIQMQAVTELEKESSQKQELESIRTALQEQKEEISELKKQINNQRGSYDLEEVIGWEGQTNDIVNRQKLIIKGLGEIAAEVRTKTGKPALKQQA